MDTTRVKPNCLPPSPPPVVLPGPSIQRQRLLPSSTQQHGSVPAQRCHPFGAMARLREPGSPRPKPEGLLSPAGSGSGTGPLHPLPLPETVTAPFLHWPGWAAGIHFRPDDQPRLQPSAILSHRAEMEPRGYAVSPNWCREQQTGSTDESEPSPVSNQVEDSVWPAKQPKKGRDEGQR